MKPVCFENKKLKLIDQRKLPLDLIINEYVDYRAVCIAIKDMVVRGAPAIGVTAAYGTYLAALEFEKESPEIFFTNMEKALVEFSKTRPTAVNLFWAINKMRFLLSSSKNLPNSHITILIKEKADEIFNEDVLLCKQIGDNGATLIKNESCILTHCNAGALATSDYGTALGVVRSAFKQGKVKMVYADETRPFLQGSRLTAYELHHDEIPVTVITDNMAGYFMQQKMIDCVVTGADRIAANGDTANKIGTYSLAVLAKFHNIPFYIAAPYSTFDFNIATGDDITIEYRNPKEVSHISGIQVVPNGVNILNPAFDVTPSELITAIITERDIITPPYVDNIRKYGSHL